MAKTDIKMSSRYKKWVFIGIILIALCFVLIRSNRNSEFRAAKKAFNAEEYTQAAELFSALGTFSDSDSYVIYCHALDAFTREDYENALTHFEKIETFQKSAKYILYSQAMLAYENSQYWEAASLFEECGKSIFGHTEFLDNETKAKMCYYTSGWILETTGDYERAITCYRLADDFDDAETRLKECEEALNRNHNHSGE